MAQKRKKTTKFTKRYRKRQARRRFKKERGLPNERAFHCLICNAPLSFLTKKDVLLLTDLICKKCKKAQLDREIFSEGKTFSAEIKDSIKVGEKERNSSLKKAKTFLSKLFKV